MFYSNDNHTLDSIQGLMEYKDDYGDWHRIRYLHYREMHLFCREFGFSFGTIKYDENTLRTIQDNLKTSSLKINCFSNSTKISDCEFHLEYEIGVTNIHLSTDKLIM